MHFFSTSALHERRLQLGKALYYSLLGAEHVERGAIRQTYLSNAFRLAKKIKRQATVDFNSLQPTALHEQLNNPRTYSAAFRNQPADLPPIVSLTSISTRIERLTRTIRTILDQSRFIHSVNLYISSHPFLLDKGISSDSGAIKALRDQGVNIYSVPNLGPYRKQVPIVKQLLASNAPPNTPIITIDDDVLYPPGLVEEIMQKLSLLDSTVAHRGRKINIQDCGAIAYYKDFSPPNKNLSVLNLGTGKNGIGYKLRFFPTSPNQFVGHILAPTADDIWCKWITLPFCMPTFILEPQAAYDHSLDFKETDQSDKSSLFHQFNKGDSNDIAIKCCEFYFSLNGPTLAEKYMSKNND